jgi:predicted nucleotidyltransferase
MIQKEIIQDIKSRLHKSIGTRFRGIVVYGSEARDEAAKDSDIDILVLLTGPISLWEDTHAIVESLYDIQLQILRPFHVTPVNYKSFKAGEYALYRNAKREGIIA